MFGQTLGLSARKEGAHHGKCTIDLGKGLDGCWPVRDSETRRAYIHLLSVFLNEAVMRDELDLLCTCPTWKKRNFK